MAGSVDALFLPFEDGLLPSIDGPCLFLGARQPQAGLPKGLEIMCEQPMRASFLELETRGASVKPFIDTDTKFAAAFILIGKHRADNETLVLRAARMCDIGAPIIIAGEKTTGIAPLKKRIDKRVEIDGSLAKYHATCFWLRNSAEITGAFEQKTASVNAAGFHTAPGMFSHEKIDKGSALLAQYIDETVRGDVADFGAGWGYLSKILLERGRTRSIALYEAHWPSLEAAKVNLGSIAHETPIAYQWTDLTGEPMKQRFDAIIMNPPFHESRKSEPALGEAFIKAASVGLKKKGRLLMVANTALPYEKVLREHFSKVDCLTVQNGFKILSAIK